MKKIYYFVPVLLIIIGIPIALIIYNQNKNNKDTEKNNSTSQNESKDPEGTIYIEAGTGTLLGGGSFSYIKESARGLEAYLAEKGASAVYNIDVQYAGTYTLWIKLSDDGVHPHNTRDATIVINNSRTMMYKHFSEDTKGWKWYEIGDTELLKGSNNVIFTKNESSSGAYVMDEYKFIPKNLTENN